jgi:AcrR family transcriptional regulator
MTKQEIREPKQKRSIEKKQSIIMASYKLFSDKGYYKTNTAEIAQEAGVSTGIVYNYFQDKKDILLEVIKFYISSLSEQFQPLLSAPINKNNLPARIEQFIDISIASHTMNVEAHNEFLALSLLEKDIFTLFNDFENTVLLKFYELLITAQFSSTDLLEKIRISYGLVEQVCHYYIHQKLSQEELNTSKLLAIRTIVTLLEKNK